MKDLTIHQIINARASSINRGLTYMECMPLIMLKYRKDSSLATKAYKK
ncbi:hypothetical protein QE439_000859 [Pedobacter agri]|nr:hypothetical protein [Pedobacter agri]